MNSYIQYAIVFLIFAVALYYVWTRVLFKKPSKASNCSTGCGKCG
ncbi:FeoB-associated Cys-rich membrane protein [Psychrobacter sp.]